MMTAKCQYCEATISTRGLKIVNRRYECRAELQCFRRLLAKFREAKTVGDQMSNACFNVSQNSALSAADRTSLASLYGRWDQMKKMLEAK